MYKIVVSVLLLLTITAHGQKKNEAFIRLSMPSKENNAARAAKQYVSGATCVSCKLTINKKEVKVLPTGAFATAIELQPGSNTINLESKGPGGTVVTKKLVYEYTIPKPDTVKDFRFASVRMIPEGNQVVAPGDRIRFIVKALPGCKLVANGNVQLYEMPTSPDNPVPGIYQGEYQVKETDSFSRSTIPIVMTGPDNQTLVQHTSNHLTMLSGLPADIVITKGRLAYLLFGLGEDRLGGSKMGYIDSLIPLRVTGKAGNLFRVQLSKYRSAWIPDDVVEFLPKGSFAPTSLSSSWRVYGDSAFDYVQVAFSSRLPYQSQQLSDPSRLVVDVYGATNNTNWITQLENTKEIKSVHYEQLEDEVLRIVIQLKHRQHWGHQIYYQGNRLVIKVRRQPARLELRDLRIAIDPGHGGGNAGTYGPTGSSEKELALAVALKLRQSLRLQGAKTIMTRVSETFVDNKERILMYRDSLPDLLISLHFNSSGNPVDVKGTSTYYRHPGFRKLSRDIYRRMLELDLAEFGNIGSFNFMLNSPTEYPNALVEILFLSNPEDEMLILDEKFQQQVADKIVAGIRDFLEGCSKDDGEQ